MKLGPHDPSEMEPTFAAFTTFAEAVTLNFSFTAPTMAALSDTLGFPPDQLKIILVLFGAFPLGLLHTSLPGRHARHAFSAIAGVIMAQFVYGTVWAHTLVCALAAYALMWADPRRAPRRVFVMLMAYLSIGHILRMREDSMEYKLDITGPLMLLTIKLSSLAYNVADGLALGGAASDTKVHPKVLARRAAVALPALPSLLEFFGFVYCFGTFFVGPAFEMREYLDATARTYLGGDVLPAHRLGPVARKLGLGALFLALFALISPGFDASTLATAERLAVPWPSRFAHMLACVYITRWRYYAGWYLAEASCVFMGFGFVRQQTGREAVKKEEEQAAEPCWDGVCNVRWEKVDWPESVKSLVDNWNMCTQQWLAHYVYARTGNSLLITYGTSAFWHGFYPGYYLFFLCMPLLTKVNRLCYRRVSPRFVRSDGTYPVWFNIACAISTSFVLNWLVTPFFVLSLDASIAQWSSYYYGGHIVLVIALLAIPMLSAPPSTADDAKKKT